MRNEKGFTLIELLVVVAILGILSVISLKQFAFYRAQAFCARVESDVKNTVTALEGVYADTQDYTTLTAPTQSNGVTVNMDVTTTTINTVTGNHTVCQKGDFIFTGATGVYAWQ
ncbi:MAG: type II secretion system protein [Deltaproteobacteria bacterium]|nr:type II secretion system protein [Deltaproteobacteria bacterium]